MNIFLVRHGQSESQVNAKILQTVLDANITITGLGQAQAKGSACALKGLILLSPGIAEMHVSSFSRAQQTAAQFVDQLGLASTGGVIDSMTLQNSLTERCQGIVAGLTREDFKEEHPDLFDSFERAWSTKSFHDADVPHGENYSQVEKRLEPFVGVLNDAVAREIKNIIVIGHNVTNRLLVKKLLKIDWPCYYSTEFATGNCDIRQLKKFGSEWVDFGYVYRSPV